MQMKLLKCMKTRKFPRGASPRALPELFSAGTQNCVNIYKNLYICCVGPDTYALIDLFLLYVTLFSPPELLNFMNHTCSLFLFRKPFMYSLTNNPRSHALTSYLSKSNWDGKATFKKILVLQNISWYWETIIYANIFFN